MLTIKDLKVSYTDVPVLEGLSLELEARKIHGIVGLNGSGKTTLFNTIYGLIKPKKGTITWEGHAISRKQTSFLETQNYFYSNITGREYLQLFPTDNPSFDLQAWESLLRLPLDELVDTYSTGMKKKLALLGILKLNKPMLLLDEPFNGIDLETSRIIKILLEKLRDKNKTILVSSHILETLTNTCDYIHFLENGQIKKSYGRNQLNQLEEDIFKNMEEELKEKINKAI